MKKSKLMTMMLLFCIGSGLISACTKEESEDTNNMNEYSWVTVLPATEPGKTLLDPKYYNKKDVYYHAEWLINNKSVLQTRIGFLATTWANNGISIDNMPNDYILSWLYMFSGTNIPVIKESSNCILLFDYTGESETCRYYELTFLDLLYHAPSKCGYRIDINNVVYDVLFEPESFVDNPTAIYDFVNDKFTLNMKLKEITIRNPETKETLKHQYNTPIDMTIVTKGRFEIE